MEFINLDEPLFTSVGFEPSDVVAIQKHAYELIPEYDKYLVLAEQVIPWGQWFKENSNIDVSKLNINFISSLKFFFKTIENFKLELTVVDLFQNIDDPEQVLRFMATKRLQKLEEEVKSLREKSQSKLN